MESRFSDGRVVHCALDEDSDPVLPEDSLSLRLEDEIGVRTELLRFRPRGRGWAGGAGCCGGGCEGGCGRGGGG